MMEVTQMADDSTGGSSWADARESGAVSLPHHAASSSHLRRSEMIAGYLFLLPNFLGFLVFSLLPIVAAFALTLTDWNLVKAPQFVALDNYRQMLNDQLFWQTAWNSVYYTIGAVPIGIFIAFCLSLILNRKMRGIIFFRTVYFLPQVTLTVAIAIVWAWIYNPQVGLINYLLSLI